MAIFWREMFNTQGESTTLADMNAGSSGTAGTYAPPLNGRLLRVALLWAGEAATSLVENLRVELECNIWKPNRLHIGLVGAGIRTAPAFPISPFVFDVDQPVQTDMPITGQYIHATAATPVTSNLRVFGLFQA